MLVTGGSTSICISKGGELKDRQGLSGVLHFWLGLQVCNLASAGHISEKSRRLAEPSVHGKGQIKCVSFSTFS